MEAGPDVHVQARGGRGLGRRLAVPRPLALDGRLDQGGLYGALSIRAKGQKKPDREFVVFFEKQLNFNTIDGLAFINNTPTFRAKVGDVVQWDVLGLGDDHHSFHVHGHRWMTADGPRDVQTVSPAESFVFRWKEDRVGTWLYHCHVEEHMMNGMIGLYVVTK